LNDTQGQFVISPSVYICIYLNKKFHQYDFTKFALLLYLLPDVNDWNHSKSCTYGDKKKNH